jgi:hypothetical protein
MIGGLGGGGEELGPTIMEEICPGIHQHLQFYHHPPPCGTRWELHMECKYSLFPGSTGISLGGALRVCGKRMPVSVGAMSRLAVCRVCNTCGNRIGLYGTSWDCLAALG